MIPFDDDFFDRVFGEIDSESLENTLDEEVDRVDLIEAHTRNEEEERARVQALQLENQNKEQDMVFRRDLTQRISEISFWWLLFLAVILIMQGYKHPLSATFYFKLADSTVNLLLGTTTATILGLFFIVIRYFFSKNTSK